MKKLLVFGVIVLFIGVSVIPSTGNLVKKSNSPIELIIDGPSYGKVGEPLEYFLILTGPEGYEVWYFIDWDDGTVVDWFGPFMTNEYTLASHTWNECGIYTIQVTAECNGSYYNASFEVTINDPPEPPIIDGPQYGKSNTEYEYTFITDDPDGDVIYLNISWDDGTYEDWIGPYDSYEEVTISHSWSENGTYEIKAKAKDYFNESHWSSPYTVIIGNSPPSKPSIDGPQTISPGTYEWTFRATDPDGDNLTYEIQWGDDTSEKGIGPYISGEKVKRSHTYYNYDTVTIIARANDTHGLTGEWGTMLVHISKDKSISSLPLLKLLDKFPLLEVILLKIINL